VLDDLDGSASELGFLLAVSVVPQVLFILVGGIWADRLPRHLVMVSTDLVMAAAQATVAVLLLTGTAELWHLLVTQLVRGTASAFFFPASTGLVPQVASAPRLQQANALLRLSMSGTSIFGSAAAGVVVALAGAGWAIAFDALTYLVSAIVLSRLRLPKTARIQAKNFLRELREGWSEFASRTWLWAIVIQFAFINAFAHGALLVLGPVVADRSLGGAGAWGLILAAEAAGLLVGGLIALRVRPVRLLLVGTLAVLLAAPEYVLLAQPSPVALIAAAALLTGIGIELFSVFWDTSLQQQIPLDRLSRVSSYDALGSIVFIPVGLAIAGPIADAIGVRETLYLAAAIVVVPTLLVLLVDDVRQLRRTDAQPAIAVR
jgi:MFS family permease